MDKSKYNPNIYNFLYMLDHFKEELNIYSDLNELDGINISAKFHSNITKLIIEIDQLKKEIL